MIAVVFMRPPSRFAGSISRRRGEGHAAGCGVNQRRRAKEECRCASRKTELTIETEPREIKEITGEIAGWVARQGIARGLLTVFIPHTSASLLIQENYSPDVRHDLAPSWRGSRRRSRPATATTTRGRTTCRRI
jgi:hypothetical protein